MYFKIKWNYINKANYISMLLFIIKVYNLGIATM